MNRRLTMVLAVLLLGVFLVACGGSPQATSAPVATTEAPPPEATQPPAPEGYQGGPVSDGATISGKISYSGPDVEPEVVEVDKDQEVCGDAKEVSKVQVDASGGLAGAVVRITDITSGKPLNTLGSEFVLDQKDCEYIPGVMVVPVGASLTVLNSDGILHNIHTTPFDNPPLNVAQPASEPELSSDPFTFPEFVPVGCDVHKWMNATIAVVDNPYAVVTGADGTFSLTDVPAGTYTLEVWHPELGTQTATATVEAGGSAEVSVDYP